MKYLDEIARRNQKHWDIRGEEKDQYTQPWLDLKKEILCAYAADRLSITLPLYGQMTEEEFEHVTKGLKEIL